MVKVLGMLVLALVAGVLLVWVTINAGVLLARHLRHADAAAATARLGIAALWFAGAVAALGAFVLATHLLAHTPAIRGADGATPPNAVADLRQVTLNGRREWITVRGMNRENPVLLFLAGGPGGTQMIAARHALAALEQTFTVVQWDQPGAGKSYLAAGFAPITLGMYIADGLALTRLLCAEYGVSQVLLVGESWGSVLGVYMAAQAPELFSALIGTGQMIAFTETDRIDYRQALALARERGDAATEQQLLANGEPPYFGGQVTMRYAAFLQYLTNEMGHNPAIKNRGYNTLRDMTGEEYGALDSVFFALGLLRTFSDVYQQLAEADLRNGYAALAVPVYVFQGRHDINAPASLVEDYYAMLDAPSKELVWFEHSGHNPWLNEPDAFVREVLRVTQGV